MLQGIMETDVIVCPRQDSCMLTEGQKELCEVMKPYKCPSLDPYQADRYMTIVNTCAELIDAASDSEIKKIEANLRLGEMVAEVLRVAKYGGRDIEKLAAAISKVRGKTVYPQRLYEAYEVWDTVRTMDKVYEIQKKLNEDISWNWLVKNAVRGFEKENIADVRHEKIQKTLRHIENTVSKIETLDRAKENLDENTAKEFEGVIYNLYQTVSKIVENGVISNNETDLSKTGKTDRTGKKDHTPYVTGADSSGLSEVLQTPVEKGEYTQLERREQFLEEEKSGEEKHEDISELLELLDTIYELMSIAIERRDWEGIEDTQKNLLNVIEKIRHRFS